MTTNHPSSDGAPDAQPPVPAVVAPRAVTSVALHAAASRLAFRSVRRDRSGATLGVLVDPAGAIHDLALSAAGAWTLTPSPPTGTPSPGRASSVLLYESAANVLRGGAANANGTIAYAGGDYRLEPGVDGPLRTAKLASA
jgi:hypothetical protein